MHKEEKKYDVNDIKDLINLLSLYSTWTTGYPDSAEDYFDRRSHFTEDKKEEINKCKAAIEMLKSEDSEIWETYKTLNKENKEAYIEILSHYEKILGY